MAGVAIRSPEAPIIIEAPHTFSADETSLPDLLSEVNVGLSNDLASLRNAVDAFVPRAFSGAEDDPIGPASDDSLTWSLAVGRAELWTDKQGLSFQIPITDGIVTVSGQIGAKRKNKGPLGWLEKIAGFNFT